MRFFVTNKHELTVAILYWLLAGIITIFATVYFINDPTKSLIIISALILFWLIAKNLILGLYIIIVLPITGELYRISAGPAGQVLPTDIFIPIFLLIWIIKTIYDSPTANSSEQPRAPLPPLTKPIITFIFIAAVSLIFSLTFLTPSQVLSGSLYLIRFTLYIFLYFATRSILKKAPPKKTGNASSRLLIAITVATLFIALAGFLQLIIYPDLTPLEELGWDPHMNRLVSTWLDPNFVGGLFAFIITILTSLLLNIKKTDRAKTDIRCAKLIGCLHHKCPPPKLLRPSLLRPSLLLTILILTIALFLTYSRSAYLALAAGLIIISIIKSRKLLLIIIIIATLGISVSDRAQQRVGELIQSATSIISVSAQNPDPTARLRIQSWQQTWEIFTTHPILGTGYNNLRAINHMKGFVSSEETHSAGGSDSSLLTILATTGIAGFLAFISIYFSLITRTIKTLLINKKHPAPSVKKPSTLASGLALGLLGGITALLIHSVFTNSLLFANISIYFWIITAIYIHETYRETLS